MKHALLPAALAALFLFAPPAFADSGALSFGKPKAAESADLVTVEAKGQGETVEAAKKDAIRNAIKTAVGELVDAKTLVENDELVSDKILTLSNAMVEKADYGEAESSGDGLWTISVTAVVKKGRLNKELEKIGIATGAVSGSSLAATLFSGRERVANAEKFFAERFKDFPGNVVEAIMLAKDDGTPDIEIDTDKGHVFANVGLRANTTNYIEWTKQLQEVLGAVCLEQEKTNLKFDGNVMQSDADGIPYVESEPQRLRFSQKKLAAPLVVATPAAEKVRRNTWPVTVFWLDEQIWKAFAKALAVQYPDSGTLEVILTDEDDEPVCSTVLDINVCSATKRLDHLYVGAAFAFIPLFAEANGYGPIENSAFIAPAFKLWITPRWEFMRSRDFTVKFRIDLGEVSEDDLDAVTGFQVKVEYTKPQAGKN